MRSATRRMFIPFQTVFQYQPTNAGIKFKNAHHWLRVRNDRKDEIETVKIYSDKLYFRCRVIDWRTADILFQEWVILKLFETIGRRNQKHRCSPTNNFAQFTRLFCQLHRNWIYTCSCKYWREQCQWVPRKNSIVSSSTMLTKGSDPFKIPLTIYTYIIRLPSIIRQESYIYRYLLDHL